MTMIASSLSRDRIVHRKDDTKKSMEHIPMFMKGGSFTSSLYYRRCLRFLAPLTIYPVEARVKTSLLV